MSLLLSHEDISQISLEENDGTGASNLREDRALRILLVGRRSLLLLKGVMRSAVGGACDTRYSSLSL